MKHRPQYVPLILLILLTTSCSAPRPAPRPTLPAAWIRVDQVGWTTGETKIALLMAQSDVAGAKATVVDAHDHPVLTIAAGSSRGDWNTRYRAINPLDLTALRTPGTYRVRMDDRVSAESPAFRVDAAGKLWSPLVSDTVQYFQAHRDGPDQIGEQWQRTSAHLDDKSATVYLTPDDDGDLTPTTTHVDVAGGWYDAGDYLKFTHTTAYALIVMQLVQRDGPAPAALTAEIEHGLDWLTRMYPGGVLYTQVGVGGNDEYLGDHDAWRLPQADDGLDVEPGDRRYYQRYRPVFRAAEPGKPISPNLAGRVAAAFALAAQLQARTDPARAKSHLDTAARLFGQADTSMSDDDLVTTVPRDFYPEESFADDLALGSAELALAGKALGDKRVKDWTDQAKRWADETGGGDDGLTVYDVDALADAELYRLAPANALAIDLRGRLDKAVKAATADPMGATSGAGGADYASRQLGWAATAALYQRMTGDHRYAAFATAQRAVALGANGWGVSLVIGAGDDYPKCPHDQIGTLTRTSLTGAVVNGPNAAGRVESLAEETPDSLCSDGSYAEFDRDDAQYLDDMRVSATNEPALDFTATGMLAFALAAAG